MFKEVYNGPVPEMFEVLLTSFQGILHYKHRSADKFFIKYVHGYSAGNHYQMIKK